VETIQLVSKVGSFDVDDLLLNTIGGFIGCLAFLWMNRIRRSYEEKEKK
jgi:glycopeptide antibiotics resistance protein